LEFVATEDPKPARKRKRSPTATTPDTRPRKILSWIAIFVAAVIIVDGLVGERGLMAMLRARQEYDELSTAIDQQRAENARLREEARRLKDDPGAIEEVARRELGLIRPGEKVFIVRDATPPAKP